MLVGMSEYLNVSDKKEHSHTCTSTCRNGSHWGAADVPFEPDSETVDSFMEHIQASMDAGHDQSEEYSSSSTGSADSEDA